jgi:hypothetical protein
MSIVNPGPGTGTVRVRKSTNLTPQLKTLGPKDVTLHVGEMLCWTPSKGFRVMDATGRYRAASCKMGLTGNIWLPGMNHNATVASTVQILTGPATHHIVYMGKANRDLPGLMACFNYVSLPTTVNAAYMSLWKGPLVLGTGGSAVTCVGRTEWTASAATVGRRKIWIPVADGFNIRDGDDVWILFTGVSVGTAATIRAMSTGDDLQSGVYGIINGIPNDPQPGEISTVTVNSSTALSPWVWAKG